MSDFRNGRSPSGSSRSLVKTNRLRERSRRWSDEEVFTVTFSDPGSGGSDQPPALDPIADALTGNDQVSVNVTGSDDGAGLITPAQRFDEEVVITAFGQVVGGDSVELQQAVFDLDFSVSGSLSEDFYGAGEKWLRSNSTSLWYFVLPTGQLIRWHGQPSATGEKIADLDPSAHLDPVSEIVNASTSSEIPVVGSSDLDFEIQLDDQELTVSRISGTGTVSVSVMATDADGLTDNEEFEVTFTESVGGGDLDLAAIEDQNDDGTGAITTELLVTGESLETPVFSVEVQTIESSLNEEYDFQFPSNDYFDYAGQGERWLQSAGGDWFIVMPPGAVTGLSQLIAWDGGFGASGEVIAQIDGSAHSDLSVLTNATGLTTSVTGSVSADDGKYTLELQADAFFAGRVKVTVMATASGTSDGESFWAAFETIP